VLDSDSNEELALKSIPVEAADHIYLLKREFRTLAELQHPNLVQFHELFSNGDSTYFTMEFIDGEPFGARDASVRRSLRVDYAAFCERALQLVEGVGYLHVRGKLHRDLKPSNVLVSREGRVVLLDFGLATSALGDERDRDALVGTLAYMAPECFFRAAPAPSGDWYAVGVMLYEALAGALPFPSNQTHILAKQRNRFPPLQQAAPGTPEPLAALVHSLLAADAAARPGFESLRAQLSQPLRTPSSVAPSSPRARSEFVGRAAETRVLLDALEATERSGPRLVMVEGRSGEGKTSLVDHFLQQLPPQEVAVFRGRCHPSEFVAFKALDGVIDDLSEHLAALGDEAAAYLGPQHPALCRVFPVLGRVGLHSTVHSTTPSPHDVELRRAAFSALRDLFQQLSARRPLIIWIDDLQWGQEDSGRLLSELLRPAAASPILFILSFRSDERKSSHCIRVVDAALAAAELEGLLVDQIMLRPLESAEARELVRAVLSRQADAELGVAEQYAELVVRGGQGNAFILSEFARYVADSLNDGDVSLDATLGDMLQRRFERLPDQARRIASIAAIAGRPLSREVLLGASAADVRGPAMLHMLLKSSLLRTIDVDTESSYIVYHDQIRQALLDGLPPRERVGGHARIAETLLATLAPDPEHLLEHLLQAEQRPRAAPFAYYAAVRAAKMLAFERASGLFELAIQLGYTGAPAWTVQVRQAEALANAGRGRRAAEVFLTAAATLPAGHDSADLRRRAAEQFLHSGCLGDGERVLTELLSGIGVRLPRSMLVATLRSLARRLWINLKGRRYELRAPEDIDPKAAARVDLLWAGTTGLTLINHTQADAINVRLLAETLKLGERSRVVRALAYEAAVEASIGGFLAAKSWRTLNEASAVAAGSEDPYDRAWVLQATCTMHWFQERWQQSADDGARALELYRGLARGTQWEQAAVQTFRLSALAQLGRFETLSAELPELLHDALQRGDLFAAAVMDGSSSYFVGLARGTPERVLELTGQAVLPWPKTVFLAPHYRHLLSTTNALLYVGRAGEALERLSQTWPAVQRARFLLLPYIGAELRFLRGRAILASLPGLKDHRRRRALTVLRGETNALSRQRGQYAQAAFHCLKAGQLEQSGFVVPAARALEAASDRFGALQMSALSQSCRLLGAQLARNEASAASATLQLRGMGVVDPERFARCLTVGDVSRLSEVALEAGARCRVQNH
jgi:hypothetical protein